MTDKPCYTVKMVAVELGVTTGRVHGWISAGHLPAINVSKKNFPPRWRIDAAELEAFKLKPTPPLPPRWVNPSFRPFRRVLLGPRTGE